MWIDKDNFEEWMRRIMERFERLEHRLDKSKKENYMIDGIKLLDNQDLCFMLNCSKRTLQRLRVSGLLPCKRIRQKTYYLETDVKKFISENLRKANGKTGDT